MKETRIPKRGFLWTPTTSSSKVRRLAVTWMFKTTKELAEMIMRNFHVIVRVIQKTLDVGEKRTRIYLNLRL
ncbi:hypothetical protein BpHYR1_049837 [Brachionus plicatilis]|uniref:Uncharacterized protein n=1 Tax=Brachionus plicatilis TaxID=10195 RepID=A0A3M7RRJ6_BRAPC|nr:hypothetical protein BpHYR1_049837 [Brachionus plicatilis]